MSLDILDFLKVEIGTDKRKETLMFSISLIDIYTDRVEASYLKAFQVADSCSQF